MLHGFYAKYPKSSVHIQYDSSGNLTKDIQDGRKYDLFLSADMKYPNILYKNGMAAERPKAYARGFIVLVAPNHKIQTTNDLKYLLKKSVKKIIIANNKTAPYGKASIEVLKNTNLYNSLKGKIFYSSDIALVIDEVLWNKNIGFIPQSALKIFLKHKIHSVKIDKKLYSPIIQGYTVSKSGKKNKNIINFLSFITSKEGIKIFEKYGYKAP